MNRKILFRGKRVDNGEWMEGSLLSFESGAPAIAQSKSIALFPKEKSMISIANCFEVIPETVGQYTGLKDKNGKQIFEGDIVRSELDYHFHMVEFVGYEFYGWCLLDMRTQECQYIYEYSEIEVIGNIYDNPELMEGKANV